MENTLIRTEEIVAQGQPEVSSASGGQIGGTEMAGDLVTPTIPLKLTSFDIFTRAIKRAQNLINFHDDPTKDEREEHADAFRAGIVLSISALDAFIRSLVIDKIKSVLVSQREKKNINQKLEKYLKEVLGPDKIFEAARRYNLHEIVDRHVRDDFEAKSFQGEHKIEHYMDLAGYENIFKKVSKKDNISEENLRGDIARYTKRRHVIAHAGDYDLNQSTPIENTINKEYAQKCVEIVTTFATTVNELCKS